MDQSMIELMLALISMYVTTGKVVLPPGRREEYVALLTDLMAASDICDAYLDALKSELERLEIRFNVQENMDLDIPGEQIAREGFVNVPDENLADIALSPEAIEAVREYLFSEMLDLDKESVGTWFIEAVLRIERSRPLDPEEYARSCATFDAVREISGREMSEAERLRFQEVVKYRPDQDQPPVLERLKAAGFIA